MKVSVYDLLDGNYKPNSADEIHAENAIDDILTELGLMGKNFVPATVNGHDLKVWDDAKYGIIVDEFVEKKIKYVVVKFNHPGNPPSNDNEYLYLAPEGR